MDCGSPYGPADIEYLCPWCIANGAAHDKLGAESVDPAPLRSENVPQAIVDEMSQRRPGYIRWQQEQWLACCGDACEVHGDAPAAELEALDEDGLNALAMDSGFALDDLPEILAHYQPKGSPAFYKFVCRHCGTVRYGGDCH